MAQGQQMMSNQSTPVAVVLKDLGGEVFTHIDELPPGTLITIESSAPTIVGVVMNPDGLSATLTSDDLGTATITVSATKPDGSPWVGSPDNLEITVVHSDPDTMTVMLSAPVPE